MFCLGKRFRQQILPRQRCQWQPSANHTCNHICVERRLIGILKLCMTRMINLSYYFANIICMIRNFTIVSPLLVSATSRLTIMTFSFTSWAPHEAVNRFHDSTYMVKYEEGIKYVGSIFIQRQKMPWRHILTGGMFVLLHCDKLQKN